MNYYYLITIAVIVILMCYASSATEPIKSRNYVPRLNHLIDAIQFVESGVRKEGDKVFLEKGAAGEIGPFQVKDIMIAEVNHKLKTKYTRDDWIDYDESRKILRQFFNYTCVAYMLAKNSGSYPTEETLARFWNSGHIGKNFEATDAYWEKVSTQLDKSVKLTHEETMEQLQETLDLANGT